MVLGLSALNMDWYLISSESALDPSLTGYGSKTVVEQRRLSVFILVNNASRQLCFHLRFTAVNAKFWDYSPSLLGSVSFYLL